MFQRALGKMKDIHHDRHRLHHAMYRIAVSAIVDRERSRHGTGDRVHPVVKAGAASPDCFAITPSRDGCGLGSTADRGRTPDAGPFARWGDRSLRADQPAAEHHGARTSPSLSGVDEGPVSAPASTYITNTGRTSRQCLPASRWSPAIAAGIGTTPEIDGFLSVRRIGPALDHRASALRAARGHFLGRDRFGFSLR